MLRQQWTSKCPCLPDDDVYYCICFRTAGSQLPLREDIGHGVAPSLNGLPLIESEATADPEQGPVHRMSRLCVRIHMRSSIVFTARRVAQTAIRRYMKGAVDTGAALGAGACG